MRCFLIEMFPLYAIILIIFNIFINCDSSKTDLDIDTNGYIAFCPCMGRFGNQADQFLGALAFAKRLNRTLILPPWVEYIPFQVGSKQIPFKTYFKPEAVRLYHRAIEMEIFMKKLAPTIWPPEKRYSFCYSERAEDKGCNAKEGNPFGPFWDNFNVDFVGSVIFGPKLHYLSSPDDYLWREKYSGTEYPVLAFVGAPAVFPVEKENLHLQEYLQWNDNILAKAKEFVRTLPKGPFIGIHLRNGGDWPKVCELVDGSRELFASPQCTGYGNDNAGILTREMCFPSSNTIIKHIKRGVKSLKATSVFVASDKDHMLSELNTALKRLNATAHKLNYNSPHVDLAILGLSNLFIGNCVSSYSAFVKRERDVFTFDTEFWAYPPEAAKYRKKVNNMNEHNEL